VGQYVRGVCFCNNTDSFTLDKGDFLNIRCICAASNDGTVAKVGMDKCVISIYNMPSNTVFEPPPSWPG
jgi:hypothetical protein